MKFIDKIKNGYCKSNQRLILLDYDGTLTTFFGMPEEARPGEDILKLLEKLVSDPKNEVVLLSGRDKDTLEKWFDINAGFAAEHGAWIKEKDGEWKTIEPLSSDWKSEIRPILLAYVNKTPGSFIEEKEFSLVWHYRTVKKELGRVRSRELVNTLTSKAGENLQVVEGNKVVEVKNAGIDKGRAASHWISKKEWDFILAMGDDVTDEDMFAVLPKTACSIKVGHGATRARFSLDSPSSALSLLKELVED